jgi:cytochrome c peroxidase
MKKYLLAAILPWMMACEKEDIDNPDDFIQTPASISDYLDLDLDNLYPYSDVSRPNFANSIVLDPLDNTPADNPVTDEGATLGRVLFYDVQLSIDKSVSCSSCHVQANGFTDELRFSEGFDGGLTDMHSMRLANARFYSPGSMFWDKRAGSLEEQTSQPIQHPVEMGFNESNGGMDSLLHRMEEIPYYPALFEFVFGDDAITETRMQLALAQFIRSMESWGSAFDEGFAQVFDPALPGGNAIADFPNLSDEENLGKAIFLNPPPAGGAGCAGCHSLPALSLADDSQTNGLDAGQDEVFKAPSLKNIALDGHLMHDGRFSTLEEVVEHYNSGIQDGPALDNRLRAPGGEPVQLNLTIEEKAALVAFLETLTDYNLIANPAFGDPFLD